MLVGIGAGQPRSDLGAIDRFRHDAEGVEQRRKVKAREVEDFQTLRIAQQLGQIGRGGGAARDLHDIGAAVARRKLHHAQPIAMRIEPHGFRIDCHGAGVAPYVGQIAAMQTDAHSIVRSSPDPLIAFDNFIAPLFSSGGKNIKQSGLPPPRGSPPAAPGIGDRTAGGARGYGEAINEPLSQQAVHKPHGTAVSLPYFAYLNLPRGMRNSCRLSVRVASLAHDVPSGTSPLGLAQLNERSREIFRQIVESYLATGDPVGSRNLARIIPMTLSPASVRNVMADLEHAGLIYAPHTSAGRLPTERGLRFFVDALMKVGDLTENDRNAIDAQVAAAGSAKSIESVLSEASGMLSGLTRAAGVVLAVKSNTRLKHIEFVRLEPERALVVLVSEDGQVENRVLTLPPGLPTSVLTEATNFLNARIRGRTLAEARGELERELVAGKAALDQLTQKIVAAGLASWSGGENEERKLIVRGQAHLLEDLHALEDLERVRLLFDDLEEKRGVADLLGRAELAEGMRIFIGSENKLFSLSGSSTIVSPYRDGQGRIVGVIGVIGPTRLNYARIIPMVDYTAKVVSKVLAG